MRETNSEGGCSNDETQNRIGCRRRSYRRCRERFAGNNRKSARNVRSQKGDTNADIAYFCEYAKREEADAFVLGLPKNMDGTEGDRAVVTRQFGDMLQEASGLPVLYQDERLTTVSAERMLIDADVRREKRKKVIDKVAATIILQSYLDSHR